MTYPPPNTKGVVVKVLLRNVPDLEPEGEVALKVYKAALIGVGDEYAVMGYSWEPE